MFLSEVGCEEYWVQMTEDHVHWKALALVMLIVMLSGN